VLFEIGREPLKSKEAVTVTCKTLEVASKRKRGEEGFVRTRKVSPLKTLKLRGSQEQEGRN
jgi:hypothetical protein